jgi:asparagine synthase (glutamine-hydrolysing)
MSVAEKIKDTVCFTAGMEGSEDIKFSEKVAAEAGLKLIVRVIEQDEVPSYALKTMKSLNFFDTMQLGIGIPEFVAAEEASRHNIKVVFSGQGSDEIFAGYSHYKAMLSNQTHKEIEGEIWASLENMWSRNLMRDDAVTAAHSLEMRLPFLGLDFLREAMAIPASMKILSKDDQLRKHPVRNLAKKFNVPEMAIQRPKKAMQYGSGIAREIEKLF